MAKIRAPLFSQSAQGTIGGNLTFSLRKSGQQVRFQNKQKDVITSDRTLQRSYYSQAVNAWNLLDPSEKIVWCNRANSLNYTGYNLFIKSYIDNLIDESEQAIYGLAIYGQAIYGFA